MFVLAEFRDTVRVPPDKFKEDSRTNIITQIEQHYGGKVVPGVGLCVCLDRIIKADEEAIFPNDGAAFIKVHFSYIVFCPHEGELLTGNVVHCSPVHGLIVHMGFFGDISIPPGLLPEPSIFIEADDNGLPGWVWQFKDEDTGAVEEMPISLGDKIRFAVDRLKYQSKDDVKPNPGNKPEDDTDMKKTVTMDSAVTDRFASSPLRLIGSINSIGLGPLSWW
ncbi:RNA polymerase III subunit Rpc25 [Carpediemonas membranifera]|uniref:RNA polymerase III subunit Rpc25 n=1 Tax=Carpediemonas membranifera TaxID=201153 RepID=A0A8J6B4D9_9EUKA|nr:RNA polymerase III subunit Rpc25 [Carpediemonas membranifera]|eukprot:KAG9394069.1 RNA polymerase III subunit Rpc25 [Carpediemonas membranifera]